MPQQILRAATRHWLALLVFALFAALLFTGVPAWADARPADVSQTVPPPPPDPTATRPVATATPGDDDNGSVVLPTPTPKPDETGAGAAQAGAPAAANLTGVITAPRVNVRSGPGTEFDVVGRMEVDQTVQVLYRNEVGDWWYTCCITTTNAGGWVSAAFVRPNFDAAQANQLIPVLAADATPAAPAATPAAPAAAAAAAAPPSGEWAGTVASAVRLNLRSEPNAEAEILGKLNPGETVSILYRNEDNDWWYVCCVAGTDVSGWVSREFLSSDLEPAAAQTALSVFVPGQVILPKPTPQAPVSLRNPSGAAALAAAQAAVNERMTKATIREMVIAALLASLGRVVDTASGAVDAAPPEAEPTAPADGGTADEASATPTAAPTRSPTRAPTATPAAAATTPQARPSATAAGTTDASEPDTAATELPPTSLELSVAQSPANATQGEEFGLTFIVTNTGDAPAVNVAIRDELAEQLNLVSGEAEAGGEFSQARTGQGAVVFTFEWPEVAPGSSVAASVILSTTGDMPDGSVLTNIAAAAADNAESVTAGVQIGMPPTTPPDFR